MRGDYRHVTGPSAIRSPKSPKSTSARSRNSRPGLVAQRAHVLGRRSFTIPNIDAYPSGSAPRLRVSSVTHRVPRRIVMPRNAMIGVAWRVRRARHHARARDVARGRHRGSREAGACRVPVVEFARHGHADSSRPRRRPRSPSSSRCTSNAARWAARRRARNASRRSSA